MNVYETFIYKRTYARWLETLKRRENWTETVNRYSDFFANKVPAEMVEGYESAISYLSNCEVMPSMRTFFTAGPALERENICGYNCSAITISSIKSFADLLYILMCGTGVGFSVERQFINQLPEVPSVLEDTNKVVVVEDSKRGWAEGLLECMIQWFDGYDPEWDLSEIRPAGERLKTFGGKASGPVPLDNMLIRIKRIVKSARGRRLNSLECHDICCHINNAVVVGGVRRASGISMSNLSDDRMRDAKQGEFWHKNPQRFLANNSTVYTEKPSILMFMKEWKSLIQSGIGERGIINRVAMDRKVSSLLNRESGKEWVVNPCGEVILRPNEFCNLSEAVVRETDTLEGLKLKVRAATAFGCLQATLTKFNFIDKEFKKNCEEERLIGVSLTGLRDHPVLGSVSEEAKSWLIELSTAVHAEGNMCSKALGINLPAAMTTVKPSGTVSQMVGCSSGIHPRFSKYYIRRVRVTSTDALCDYLKAKGVPWNPEVGEDATNASTIVFDFPVKSPEGCVTNDDVDAIEQLEYWRMLRDYWTDHNPSATIYVRDDEWLKVGSWIYENWDDVAGLSFLQKDDSIYQLAPYEEISGKQYDKLLVGFPEIDFDDLDSFERGDTTAGAQELACVGGACEWT